MTVRRVSGLDPAYLVRCELRNATGALLAENVYWQSAADDDLGEPKKRRTVQNESRQMG
jgi:exo-1,4-beta-D-glucosaminidase